MGMIIPVLGVSFKYFLGDNFSTGIHILFGWRWILYNKLLSFTILYPSIPSFI